MRLIITSCAERYRLVYLSSPPNNRHKSPYLSVLLSYYLSPLSLISELIISLITFTVTAFPSVLYLCVSLTPSVQPSGKPWSRSHSVGVNRRIFISSVRVCCCIPVSSVCATPFPTLPRLVLLFITLKFIESPTVASAYPPRVASGTFTNGCRFPPCIVFKVGLTPSVPYTLSLLCRGWLSCWM